MFLIVTGNFNPYEIAESVKENMRKKEFIYIFKEHFKKT